VNNEFERIRKEVVSAQVYVLFRHLSGGNEENHEVYEDSPSPG
jgi:hypothetical protein